MIAFNVTINSDATASTPVADARTSRILLSLTITRYQIQNKYLSD